MFDIRPNRLDHALGVGPDNEGKEHRARRDTDNIDFAQRLVVPLDEGSHELHVDWLRKPFDLRKEFGVVVLLLNPAWSAASLLCRLCVD